MSAATAAMQTGKAATKSAVLELVTIFAAWNTTDSITVAATAIAPPMAACLATDLAALFGVFLSRRWVVLDSPFFHALSVVTVLLV